MYIIMNENIHFLLTSRGVSCYPLVRRDAVDYRINANELERTLEAWDALIPGKGEGSSGRMRWNSPDADGA
jgi:hypothetical protein